MVVGIVCRRQKRKCLLLRILMSYIPWRDANLWTVALEQNWREPSCYSKEFDFAWACCKKKQTTQNTKGTAVLFQKLKARYTGWIRMWIKGSNMLWTWLIHVICTSLCGHRSFEEMVGTWIIFIKTLHALTESWFEKDVKTYTVPFLAR